MILLILVIKEIIVTKVIMVLMLEVVVKDRCVLKKWALYSHDYNYKSSCFLVKI